MSGGEREMELDEWIDRLPKKHLARRQLATLRAHAKFGINCYQDQCENAYVEFSIVEKIRSELSAERARADLLAKRVEKFKTVLDLSRQFNDAIRSRIALKEPHYTSSCILKNMLEEALKEMTTGNGGEEGWNNESSL